MTHVAYDGSAAHDLLLARWCNELIESGDWHKCFLVSQQTPSWFYGYFRRDVQLRFVTEGDRIVVAGWFEPCLARGAFFSLWIAPEWRGTIKNMRAAGDLLAWAFDHVQTILSITTQEETLAIYQAMGYTLLGQIPHLGHGGPVWLLTLTFDQLAGGLYGRWRVRQQRQGRGRALTTSRKDRPQRTRPRRGSAPQCTTAGA